MISLLNPPFDNKVTSEKLNEVIIVMNKAPNSNNLAEDLHSLLQAWKREAEDLVEHPEDFPGTTKETCVAVSHSLLKCYSEITEVLCN